MRDDSDIKREIRNTYLRTNMLIQRFRNCSVRVKTVIIKAYCVCLYGVPLWMHYNAGKNLNTVFISASRDSLVLANIIV